MAKSTQTTKKKDSPTKMAFEEEAKALGCYLVILYKEVKLVYYSIEFVKNEAGKLLKLRVSFFSESNTLASGEDLEKVLSRHYLDHLRVNNVGTAAVKIDLV